MIKRQIPTKVGTEINTLRSKYPHQCEAFWFGGNSEYVLTIVHSTSSCRKLSKFGLFVKISVNSDWVLQW